jgi:hypothetical protein
MRFVIAPFLMRPEWLPDVIPAVILLTMLSYLIYFYFYKDQTGL